MNAADLATGLRIADWLSLAAAPVFAAMALLTALQGDGAANLCGASGISPLVGMVPMYALMSLFHVGPWTRLIARSVTR
jgi:hypothetical protein